MAVCLLSVMVLVLRQQVSVLAGNTLTGCGRLDLVNSSLQPGRPEAFDQVEWMGGQLVPANIAMRPCAEDGSPSSEVLGAARLRQEAQGELRSPVYW